MPNPILFLTWVVLALGCYWYFSVKEKRKQGVRSLNKKDRLIISLMSMSIAAVIVAMVRMTC